MRAKAKNVSYTLAMVISIIVGIWHFCVPYLYEWYSILLLLVRKEFFNGDRVAQLFYKFFVIVWICRVGITIFHNWGWNIMVVGYLIAFSVELILLLIPLRREKI